MEISPFEAGKKENAAHSKGETGFVYEAAPFLPQQVKTNNGLAFEPQARTPLRSNACDFSV